MGDSGHVLRFVTVDDDGLTSAVWRVWTGSSRPSDGVYLAPRELGGDLKVSIHADGYAQLGPTLPLRERLFRTDRHALNRWSIDVTARPCVLAAVWFHRSELRDRDVPPNVLTVTMPVGVPAMVLLIMTNFNGRFPWVDGVFAGSTTVSLNRRTLAPIQATFLPVPTIHPGLDEARHLNPGPIRLPWELPVGWSEKTFGWAVINDRRFPHLLEVAFDEEPATCPPTSLPGFCGAVEPWERLPIEVPPNLELCAVIVVNDRNDEASLFINSHARCEHDYLAEQAGGVLENFRVQGPDNGWMHDEPLGLWVTGMLTREARDQAWLQSG